jgi:hypothetical protein
MDDDEDSRCKRKGHPPKRISFIFGKNDYPIPQALKPLRD